MDRPGVVGLQPYGGRILARIRRHLAGHFVRKYQATTPPMRTAMRATKTMGKMLSRGSFFGITPN